MVAPSMADALKAFPRESRCLQGTLPLRSPVMPNESNLQVRRPHRSCAHPTPPELRDQGRRRVVLDALADSVRIRRGRAHIPARGREPGEAPRKAVPRVRAQDGRAGPDPIRRTPLPPARRRAGARPQTPTRRPKSQPKGWKDILWRVYEEVEQRPHPGGGGWRDLLRAARAFPCHRSSGLDLWPVRGRRDDPGSSEHSGGLLARRRAGCDRRAGEADHLEGERNPWLRLLLRPCDLAVERQRRHEGDVRRLERRL